MFLDVTETEYKLIMVNRKKEEEQKNRDLFYSSVITAFREAGDLISIDTLRDMTIREFINCCSKNHLYLRYEKPKENILTLYRCPNRNESCFGVNCNTCGLYIQLKPKEEKNCKLCEFQDRGMFSPCMTCRNKSNFKVKCSKNDDLNGI